MKPGAWRDEAVGVGLASCTHILAAWYKDNKMTPREFFPYMPDEVFEMWLAPFIQQIGWSFTKITDDLSGTRWNTLLRDIPLDVWNQLIWSRIDVEFTKIEFAVFNKLAIEDIIGHCVHGRSTATANLPNTKERFRACAEFIRVHKTIPKPIAVMSRDKKIEVIDIRATEKCLQ